MSAKQNALIVGFVRYSGQVAVVKQDGKIVASCSTKAKTYEGFVETAAERGQELALQDSSMIGAPQMFVDGEEFQIPWQQEATDKEGNATFETIPLNLPEEIAAGSMVQVLFDTAYLEVVYKDGEAVSMRLPVGSYQLKVSRPSGVVKSFAEAIASC